MNTFEPLTLNIPVDFFTAPVVLSITNISPVVTVGRFWNLTSTWPRPAPLTINDAVGKDWP